MRSLKWDVVVVGSGAGGLSAAYMLQGLARAGKRILIVEQGDYYDSDAFPTRERDWEVRRLHNSNIDPNTYLDRVGFPIDNQDNPIAIASFNAVGGSSVLYSGHFPRFHPSDFKVRTLDGVADDWPISYFDLEPYYNLDHTITPIAGVSGDPSYPPLPDFLPAVPLGKLGAHLANTMNSLGWHWWPSYSAIATVNFRDHQRCTNIGPCNTGCPLGSKSSDDSYLLPSILKSGIELLRMTEVSKLVIDDESNRIKGLVCHSELYGEFILEAKLVILSAGGVGTPRVLLNSHSSRFLSGAANSSGLVGKNLMLHPWGHVEGIFTENLDSFYGPQGCFMASHEFHETDTQRGFMRGFSLQFQRGASLVETASRGSARRFNTYGEKGFHKIVEHYNHDASISVIVEDLPSLDNYVELDVDNKSKFGTPGIRVHYRLSVDSRKNLSFGISRAKEILKAAGAHSIMGFGPVREVGFHIAGTTKMGRSPQTSVVNGNNQSHDHPNLFISDSSVFVTSSSVNPLSTIHAIGYRTGDFIDKNFDALADETHA